jgi:hypothetical protein
MQPTPETEAYTLSRASSVDSTVPEEWSKDMGLATPLFSYIQDPLCMELSTPGTICIDPALISPDRMGHYMLKDERSPTPDPVDPTNPIIDAPTPQWPSQLSDYNHFSQFKTEDEVDFQGNIFFDVRSSMTWLNTSSSNLMPNGVSGQLDRMRIVNRVAFV